MWRFIPGFGIGLVAGMLGTIAVFVVLPATRAREQARNRSVMLTVVTIRSQIELFKIQHADLPPAEAGMWAIMLGRSNAGDVHTPTPRGEFGPYLQQAPVNPMNGQSAVGPRASPVVGWVYRASGESFTIQAVNERGDGVLAY